MDHGIEIYMNQLQSVEIAKDGKTAKIGGGTQSKAVTDKLWAAGKQTGKSTAQSSFQKLRKLTAGDSDWNL
jgi:hypothetical protein